MRDLVGFIASFIIVTSVVTCSSIIDNIHYVGCYDPAYSLRQHYHHHIASVTLAKCVQYCQGLKTRFAGVEASDNFCYCGIDIGEESVQRNNTYCNVPCPDEPLRTCGGDFLLSLYEIQGAGTVDESDYVDFLLGISTGVRLYHYNNSATYDTLMTTIDWVYSVNYHYSKNLVFVYSKSKLYKTNLEPKRNAGVTVAKTGQYIKDVSSCDGFAVDWVNDRIYWANCELNNSAGIMAMGLNGEAEQTILSRLELVGKTVKRMEIDPYKGMVFWTADGVIQSCTVLGEEFNPNVTKAEVSVRALALDLRLRRVYYVGTMNQSTSLFSMDYSGGDEVEHFSISQFRSVYGLSILGDKVYWVNYANVRDVIYEAPINLTRLEDVNMIRTIDRAVWHMRVVHPSMQRRPKIDPCLDKGCHHSEHMVDDYPSVGHGVLFVSILMVLAVCLASLVLVYFGDKYWSLMESKLFGISYSRSHNSAGNKEGEGDMGTVSSEYHTEEDNVNLI